MPKLNIPCFYFLWLCLSLCGIDAYAASDTSPDQFTFTDKTNVALKTAIQSNAITVKGIDAPVPLFVTGGQFSINGGAYKSGSAIVTKGKTVRLKQTSATTNSTTTDTVLTIGGVSDTFSVTTLPAPDTAPDAFSFKALRNVPLSTLLKSETITVTGLGAKAPISISGGKFSINGGAFRTASTTISNGKTVRVQLLSAATNYTDSQAVLAIGGVSGVFSATTLEGTDRTPNPFSFIDQTKQPLNSEVTSNTVTISGIDAPTPISVIGGTYSVNGGPFTSTPSTLTNGNSVAVRLTTAAIHAAFSHATLIIGGVSDTFSTSTAAISDKFFSPAASGGDPLFQSEHFWGSANCAVCHNGLGDNKNQDVSIETDWSSTMMANASRDPFWRAKVRSELKRNPNLAAVIGDKCTRCHAPMANFEAKSFGEDKAILDGGFLSANHARHNEALNGVSCTVCHQIQDAPSLGTLNGFSGQYEIAVANTNIDTNPKPRLIYGPFDNLFPNPMVVATGYEPSYSPHIKSSKLCATCHNLKTPFVDQFGKVLSTTPDSEFPEQMVYSEWEYSNYATNNIKTCQSCHMSRANGVAISNRPSSIPLRDGFAMHEFVGANKLMLDIFDNNKPQLGVLANNFAETIGKTQAMLASAATVTPLTSHLGSDNVLDFTLMVKSDTGHKLPTSYPSRRVILHVKVTDANNHTVFETGKINANGSVVGLDSDENGARFEPHYDLITKPDQVQAYEAIMGDNENHVTYTLLRGMVYLKDNRLLPQGFDKNTAPSDIQVVGEALADANFVGGSDQINYRISGLDGSGYTVEAELLHQPIAYSFSVDLFKEPDNEVEDFKLMFEASTAKSNRIAYHRFTVAR
ncbi:MAG: multiheme c-type cytochrome [Methylococcales bacterium]|nr:multiheme c-type cytochrome [Methylococcales bacterium]